MGIVNKLDQSKIKNSYDGAKQTRFTSDWVAGNRTADDVIKNQISILRNRSRDLERNNDYIVKFLRLLEINVVGPTGFKISNRSRTSDGKLNTPVNNIVNAEFKQWSKSKYASVNGRQSFLDIQKLCIRSVARDGEVFIYEVKNKNINKYGYALQVLEPDLLDENLNRKLSNGNRIKMGIEYNSIGRVTAFYLLTNHPGDYSFVDGARKYKRFPAEDIIHIYLEDRPTQSRGVPWVHTAILRLRQLGGYEEAELIASRIGASKMGFFTSEGAAEFQGDGQDSEGNLITNVEPGTFEKLPKNTKVELFDPDHPGSNFKDFVKANLRGVSAGLGPSYNSLASDLESVNYSSLRHGTIEERDFYRLLQEWFGESFIERVVENWFDMSILVGILNLSPSDKDILFVPKIEPRGWDWVDPLKEVKANLEAVKGGLTSRSQIMSKTGKDFQDTIDEIAFENEYAESKSVSLNDNMNISDEETKEDDENKN